MLIDTEYCFEISESYFGKKCKTAQRCNHDFVARLVGSQEYKKPLDEVTGSVLLGGTDFINFLKDRFVIGE
jgi:hypothetical protein